MIQYIYSGLHTAPGSELLTFNYLPLEFFPLLLELLQPAVLFHAASSALLTVQLPFAFLQFISLALRCFGLHSQIADHSSEGFEAVQARALGCWRPGLRTLRRAEGAEGAHHCQLALLSGGPSRCGHGAQVLRVLHVPDDLAEVEGQILAGEGEALLRAAEGERGGQGLRFRRGDGQAQGDGRAAVPVARHFLVVLWRFGLRVGDDALRVAVPERLCRARLEGALQLHHIEGILRETEAEKEEGG